MHGFTPRRAGARHNFATSAAAGKHRKAAASAAAFRTTNERADLLQEIGGKSTEVSSQGRRHPTETSALTGGTRTGKTPPKRGFICVKRRKLYFIVISRK